MDQQLANSSSCPDRAQDRRGTVKERERICRYFLIPSRNAGHLAFVLVTTTNGSFSCSEKTAQTCVAATVFGT